jgi:hypothetical protein
VTTPTGTIRPQSAPSSRHLAGAVLGSTAIAGIYGRIAWGMFERFDDFTDHLLWAQRLYETEPCPIFSSTG